MIAEKQWCHEVASLLQIREPNGLLIVLAFAESDRDRAWRFALTMAKVGLCPVEVARATLRGLGIQPGGAEV